MNRLTPVVKNMIIINVIVFFGAQMLPPGIKDMGSLYFYESDMFRPFQIVTSMFMHADLMHLAFNMMSLYFLGPYVEAKMGSKRFLILYLLCGLGASAVHMGWNAYNYYQVIDGMPMDSIQKVVEDGRDVLLRGRNYSDVAMGELNRTLNVGALGASGAVYGVMIAFAAMFPDLKLMVFPLPVPIAAKYLAVGLVIFGVFQGFGGYAQGIAHFAHLGGAITGFILVYMWNLINFR